MIISLLSWQSRRCGSYAHEGYTLIWLSYSWNRRISGFKPVLALPPLLSKSLARTILPIRHLAYLHLSNTNMVRAMGNLKGSTPSFRLPRLSIGLVTKPRLFFSQIYSSITQYRQECPRLLLLKAPGAYTIAGLSPLKIHLVRALGEEAEPTQARKVNWITMYLRTRMLGQRSSTLVRCSSKSAGSLEGTRGKRRNSCVPRTETSRYWVTIPMSSKLIYPLYEI